MFDIGASELLVIVIVAVLVIGPKDMPLALRTAGRWIGKVRRVSAHFRTGFDAMVREAEMQDMEEKWRAQNARIMAENPSGEMMPISGPDHPASDTRSATPGPSDDQNSLAENGPDGGNGADTAPDQADLPLGKPKES